MRAFTSWNCWAEIQLQIKIAAAKHRYREMKIMNKSNMLLPARAMIRFGGGAFTVRTINYKKILAPRWKRSAAPHCIPINKFRETFLALPHLWNLNAAPLSDNFPPACVRRGLKLITSATTVDRQRPQTRGMYRCNNPFRRRTSIFNSFICHLVKWLWSQRGRLMMICFSNNKMVIWKIYIAY